jgi:uncharacterized protein YjbI with pentapeptide repeats
MKKIFLGFTLGLIIGWIAGYLRVPYMESFSFSGENTGAKHQQQKIHEIEAIIQSGANANLTPLMHKLLEDIETEIKQKKHRTLKDTTIARIAALSRAFQPYPSFHDSIPNTISIERGQLLRALILLRLDKGTFARIKETALFDGADLRRANLTGVDLSNIHLAGAHLRDADLSGTTINNADLGETDLWGANLQETTCKNTNFRRANLAWAKLNNTNLSDINLNGAILTNLQCIRSKWQDIQMQWAQCDGMMLHEAILKRVNCTGTRFAQANFSKAVLSDSDWRRTDMTHADLNGIVAKNVLIDEKWQEKLKEWQPAGVQELLEKHTIASDTTDKAKKPLFRLQPVPD